MLGCVNKNHPEYKNLVRDSGLPEDIVELECRVFQSKYDRFPKLDELTKANSEKSLRENLKVNAHNSAKIDEIKEYTDSETIEESIIKINNKHRDLEVDIKPLNHEAIIEIEKRPTVYNYHIVPVEVDKNVDSVQVFNRALHKLASKYGIKFNTIRDYQLNGFPPDMASADAFVYNGEIYINIDHADVDAPLHEMMHIFAGSIRFVDPELYSNLISIVDKLPERDAIANNYPNRTRNDVNEEIFVTEVSKYIMGIDSVIRDLDPKIQYEIEYNIKRTMDSVLMGLDSVKVLSDDVLYNLTFRELVDTLNSSIMTSTPRSTLLIEKSSLHRKLNNMKSELIRKKQLKEVCD